MCPPRSWKAKRTPFGAGPCTTCGGSDRKRRNHKAVAGSPTPTLYLPKQPRFAPPAQPNRRLLLAFTFVTTTVNSGIGRVMPFDKCSKNGASTFDSLRVQ
jgi:hypothetical protein